MKKSTTTTLMLVLLTIFPLAASPMPGDSKYRPILESLSMMYAPTLEDRAGWAGTACQRMTIGGCEYFMENQADLLWRNGQEVEFNSVVPGEIIATLHDDSQVWKAHIFIFTACPSKGCPPIESDIYLHIVRDETQDTWLLNRILYGPYINPPQFEEQ